VGGVALTVPVDPLKPYDGIEGRGLIGHSSTPTFRHHFDFSDGAMIKRPTFHGEHAHLRYGPDPGDTPWQQFSPSRPRRQLPKRQPAFSRFVITKESAYLFLPGITGLAYISWCEMIPLRHRNGDPQTCGLFVLRLLAQLGSAMSADAAIWDHSSPGSICPQVHQRRHRLTLRGSG